MTKRYLIRNKTNGYVHGEYETIANLNKGIGVVKGGYTRYKGFQRDGCATFQDWLDAHALITLTESYSQDLKAKN